MTVELFQGTPEGLKLRIQAIVAMPKTIARIEVLADKSWYLIMYS